MVRCHLGRDLSSTRPKKFEAHLGFFGHVLFEENLSRRRSGCFLADEWSPLSGVPADILVVFQATSVHVSKVLDTPWNGNSGYVT